MAAVEASGRTLEACLLYHPECGVGDDVLVHMGFVVDVLDPATARDAMDLRNGLAGKPTG